MRNARSALLRTKDGACGVDREQRIVLWNEAAEIILGYPGKEVLGRHCFEVFRGRSEDGSRFCRSGCPLFRIVRSSGGIPTRTLRVRAKDGRDRWLSVTTIETPSTDPTHALFVHLFRDVSRYRSLEDMLSFLRTNIARFRTDGTADDAPTMDSPAAAAPALTNREHEVLGLVALGRSTRGIGEALCVSPSTVRNHIHNILTKLNVHSRLEAVTRARDVGII